MSEDAHTAEAFMAKVSPPSNSPTQHPTRSQSPTPSKQSTSSTILAEYNFERPSYELTYPTYQTAMAQPSTSDIHHFEAALPRGHQDTVTEEEKDAALRLAAPNWPMDFIAPSSNSILHQYLTSDTSAPNSGYWKVTDGSGNETFYSTRAEAAAANYAIAKAEYASYQERMAMNVKIIAEQERTSVIGIAQRLKETEGEEGDFVVFDVDAGEWIYVWVEKKENSKKKKVTEE